MHRAWKITSKPNPTYETISPHPYFIKHSKSCRTQTAHYNHTLPPSFRLSVQTTILQEGPLRSFILCKIECYHTSCAGYYVSLYSLALRACFCVCCFLLHLSVITFSLRKNKLAIYRLICLAITAKSSKTGMQLNCAVGLELQTQLGT